MGDHEADVFADIKWILWSGTIGFVRPWPTGAEIAKAAGYARLSISPFDVLQASRAGVKPEELGHHIRDLGLEIVLDSVMNWYGDPRTDWPFAGHKNAEVFGFELGEVLRMAEALEVVAMNAIGQPTSDVPLEELAGPFGVLCDRAAGFGSQVTLEFIPMLAINDLAAAWSIVSAAGRDNGGILFDTWHFLRGNPDFELLERIPGDGIFMTQISDAAAQLTGTAGDDTFNRLMPGDGSFDLLRVLAALDRIGALGWIGPEVISPATAAMDGGQAALVGRDRVARLIAAVRSAAQSTGGGRSET